MLGTLLLSWLPLQNIIAKICALRYLYFNSQTKSQEQAKINAGTSKAGKKVNSSHIQHVKEMKANFLLSKKVNRNEEAQVNLLSTM